MTAVGIELNGLTYFGKYTVEDDVLWLDSPFGTQSTILGGYPPMQMAKILLAEILRDKQCSSVCSSGKDFDLASPS